MGPKYLKVKATLERCSFGDIFSRGKLLEHRMFFVADQASKEMKTTWTVKDVSIYERDMLFLAIAKGLLFKLSDCHTGLNFHFWIVLRQAEAFDVTYHSQHLKLNTTYYILDDHNQTTGPFNIYENDDINHINKLINENRIYVPARKQLYEEIKNQHSA